MPTVTYMRIEADGASVQLQARDNGDITMIVRLGDEEDFTEIELAPVTARTIAGALLGMTEATV